MILVTGGAGFVGSHVVDAYVAAGHKTSIIDNLSTGSRENLNPSASFHNVDIRSQELACVFERERPTIVNHLAAQMNVSGSVADPLYDADVNIRGSINVLEQCVKYGVKKLIYASTAGAIYGQPEQLPVSEDYPPRPECHYGVSKCAVEHYIRLYHQLYGIDYTILRFSNVYGPRQNPRGEAGVCSILMGLMLENKQVTLYGHGTPVRDYVYVVDIARAALLALDKGSGRTLNISSGKGTSVLDIYHALQTLIGYDVEPSFEPLRPGEIERIYVNNAAAADSLDWHPKIALEEGLARTLEYVRSTLPVKQV